MIYIFWDCFYFLLTFPERVIWLFPFLLVGCTEIYLDGEQWNDGLLATIRERVWHQIMKFYFDFIFSFHIHFRNLLIEIRTIDAKRQFMPIQYIASCCGWLMLLDCPSFIRFIWKLRERPCLRMQICCHKKKSPIKLEPRYVFHGDARWWFFGIARCMWDLWIWELLIERIL